MAKASDQSKRIIVVGSGVSGMGCAIKLLERGCNNLTIYEKNAEVGGTWETNRYPGLTCDLPALAYTYSFERSCEFSHQYASWSEIRDYCKMVADKYRLYEHIQFNKEITEAKYENQQWRVKTSDGEEDVADIIVMATGVLRNLKYPDIEGLDQFSGKLIHTGAWDESLDLKGKKVGLIGTGATSAQLVPAIVDQVGELKLFQRTAQWVNQFLGGNSTISEEQREVLRNDPNRLQSIVDTMLVNIEAMVDGLLVDKTGNTTRKIKENCEINISCIKDPKLRNALTPDYQPGCKRLIMSDSFYPAMQHPRVRLETDAIQQVEERGIRTKDGILHELDILILATGYKMHDYMRPMKIYGENNLLLDDLWKEGEFAHRGIMIPQYPNLFMVMGPNSPLTNFSVIQVAEWQIDYICQLVEKVLSETVSVIKVDEAAARTYNEELANKSPGTIWTSGCNSYYIKDNGTPNVWPDTVAAYRETMQAPNLDEYIFTK